MELLLLNDVRKLGYIGDVVNVKNGYARNYLLPYGLAAEPSEENVQAIAQAKEDAAKDRLARQREFEGLIEKLADVSVTIEAAANPEGNLYGSVGAKEIIAALAEQGFKIDSRCVNMDQPIRTIDTQMVTLEFTDELSTEIKVWVVREGETPDAESSDDDNSAVESADEPTADSAASEVDA